MNFVIPACAGMTGYAYLGFERMVIKGCLKTGQSGFRRPLVFIRAVRPSVIFGAGFGSIGSRWDGGCAGGCGSGG